MHILVIPAWFDVSNPLSGIFFHEYCNALSSRAKVTLLNFTYHSFSEKFKTTSKPDKTGEKKYNVLSFDFYNPLPGTWFGLSAKLQRQQIIKKSLQLVKNYQMKNDKIDVVHLQSVCNNITPIIGKSIADSLRVPYVCTEHYTSFKEAGENIFKPFTSFNEVKEVVKSSSLNMAVSNFASRYCESCFETKFETVYNIIPDQFIEQPIKINNTQDFVFLCIGTLQARKGQHHLLRAFAKIVPECQNVKLILVGKGPDEKSLLDLAKQLRISERVKIINYLPSEDFISTIDTAQVIVSASNQELFGLTLIEGFFRGKPTVATRSGGPEELINSTNGLISDFADEKAMADNLLYVYKNYQSYNKEQIKQDAIKKYSESAIVPLMMDNYSKVITNYQSKRKNSNVN